MRCTGCGHTLTEGSGVCLRCGTPVTPGSQLKSVDVALLPEPVPTSGDNWAPPYGTSASPYGNAPTLTPPPPPFYEDGMQPYPNSKAYSKRVIPRRAIVLAVLVVLFAGGVSFGLIAYAHAMTRTSPGGGLGNVPVSARCVLPAVDQTAAQNLHNTQLSSGLKDPANKDFRPINNTVLFNVGQTIYVTFTVATSAAATLSADWCWGANGNTSHFQLPVDLSQNVNGYFNLRNLDSAAIGTGVIVLRWNDAVAYETLFQVK